MKKSLEYYNDINNPYRIGNDGREIFPHGTLSFRMSVHRTQYPSREDAKLIYHWHEELEIFYLHSGRLSLQVGRGNYDIQDGDIVLIPAGTPHGATKLSEAAVDFYAFLVHINFLSSFENDAIQQNYLSHIFLKGKDLPCIFHKEDSHTSELQKLLALILENYINEPIGYELRIKAKLMELFAEMIQQNAQLLDIDSEVHYAGEWVQKFFTYVQAHYQEPFSLVSLASFVNMSEGYLCRSIKKLFRQTPMEFVNQYRLLRALVFLEQSDKKISCIAEETGFSSINRFTQEFKKSKGCTPREYRHKFKDRN